MYKKSNTYEEWQKYVAQERALLEPILTKYGFSLDLIQPHVSGERYLMHAITTSNGLKLILLGTEQKSGMRVVIKATRNPQGKEELQYERDCRNAINVLPFAYERFVSPQELFFREDASFLISIQAYIPQTSSFLERPIAEQFSYALQAFKAQEHAHAATYEQIRKAKKVFETSTAEQYLENCSMFERNVRNELPDSDDLHTLFKILKEELYTMKTFISQYENFLTHTDFVPHNFRINEGMLYLLDYSSLRFGNKHEGWARFLNFMALYNPALEQAFITYFRDNRSSEENESLHIMRLYRLGEILWYYVKTLERSTDNLLILNQARVDFWSSMVHAQLAQTSLPESIRAEYIQLRDSLRSAEEIERQKNLH